jgi:hypothetical protein
MRQELASKSPRDEQYAIGLAESYEQLGDIKRDTDLEAARASFEQTLSIRRRLFSAHPQDFSKVDALSKILVRLGDVDIRTKRSDVAEARYASALAMNIGAFTSSPDDKDRQRELSWALGKFGDTRLTEDKQEALYFFDNALCLRRRMLEKQPDNAKYESDVSYALSRVAKARAALGRFESAKAAHFEATQIARRLANYERSNAEWLAGLYRVDLEAAAALAADDPFLSLVFYREAADAKVNLDKLEYKDVKDYREDEQKTRNRLTQEQIRTAEAKWAELVVGLTPESAPETSEVCWKELPDWLEKIRERQKTARP